MARTGRPRVGLTLSDGERDQLERWARRRKSSQALALRCRIVLACAEGLSNKEVPDGLDVHVVCDDHGTHKTPGVNAWLERHPRFHMHFTPTCSSWLNQAERLFAEITCQMLQRAPPASNQQPNSTTNFQRRTVAYIFGVA